MKRTFSKLFLGLLFVLTGIAIPFDVIRANAFVLYRWIILCGTCGPTQTPIGVATINLNKLTYTPGETITTEGKVEPLSCTGNQAYVINEPISCLEASVAATLTATLTANIVGQGETKTLITGNFSEGPLYGSALFTAPSTLGNYDMNFIGNIPTGASAKWGQLYATYKIPFTVCAAKYLQVCSSTATNSCGDPNYGYTNCDGSCSATTAPAERFYWNNVCTSYSNVCGQTTSGTTDCSGVCSATTPATPTGYGDSCSSNTNSCGGVNYGSLACSGTGVACSVSSTAPANPSYYGTSCTLTSAQNICGKTTTAIGTYDCNNICVGTTPAAPSNTTCVPSAPTISGLYNKNGVYLGASVPAYDSLGYQIYANATSLIPGAKLTYYFEFSIDGINWSGGQWATLP